MQEADELVEKWSADQEKFDEAKKRLDDSTFEQQIKKDAREQKRQIESAADTISILAESELEEDIMSTEDTERRDEIKKEEEKAVVSTKSEAEKAIEEANELAVEMEKPPEEHLGEWNFFCSESAPDIQKGKQTHSQQRTKVSFVVGQDEEAQLEHEEEEETNPKETEVRVTAKFWQPSQSITCLHDFRRRLDKPHFRVTPRVASNPGSQGAAERSAVGCPQGPDRAPRLASSKYACRICWLQSVCHMTGFQRAGRHLQENVVWEAVGKSSLAPSDVLPLEI
ncbi:trichohyalin [Cyclospora cayetanensis]|uniref:Trichohyalin n=1 Tax=Cyclospora cayetanensis TaxID=88456 RepID=A0A6P6RY25_9EIME|nr:trichohyalin [Cyclospora cayetanensis]